MKKLLDYLASIESGPITDASELEGVLSDCWDDFTGGNVEGMTGDKLPNRMEDIMWEPPILTFLVERHGSTVLGSTRADLHRWDLDVGDRTARCSEVGRRQIKRMQPRLNLRPIAVEIARLITGNEPDQRLRWYRDGSVRVLVSKILPEWPAVKQTLADRRKRFRTEVLRILRDEGWEEVRPHVFRRSG